MPDQGKDLNKTMIWPIRPKSDQDKNQICQKSDQDKNRNWQKSNQDKNLIWQKSDLTKTKIGTDRNLIKTKIWSDQDKNRALFENRPALYFCKYKENKVNNTRILDNIFIDDFTDIMEQYFHY